MRISLSHLRLGLPVVNGGEKPHIDSEQMPCCPRRRHGGHHCIIRQAFGFTAYDGPAYRNATDAEVLGDGLHAIRPGSVGLGDRLFPIGTMRRVIVDELSSFDTEALLFGVQGS